MWRSIANTFICLYFFCFLLSALTHEEMFGRKLPRTGHGGFYDENQYDDGYAEYTGAEKRTFSEMQRRRFQDVQEDEPQEKRELIEDLLLQELTRGEYTPKETNDVEYPYDMPRNQRKFSDFDDVRGEEDFDRLPEKRTKSDEFKEQTLDGVGTASDDLALKREEEKQRMKDEKKKFDNLPANGELFEGDIIMDQRLRSWVTGQYDKRDAINDDSYLWPSSLDENGERVIRVPYTLSDEIKRDGEKMDSIRRAIESYNRYTCVRYVPATKNDENQDHAHFLINQTMCYSSVGRQGGKQDISIGNGCERVGTVIHEMLHTIGFIHEQSRPDRDKYVRVFYDNIRSGLEHNFEKYTRGEVKTLECMKDFYDFDSCLHYNNHAFSKNGDDTIQAIKDPTRRFGQRESFSTHDILQVNELYKCHVTNLHEKMRDISYN
ncbi:zinc metalloproteinase nas-4-like isoform X3 [Orbicella faveolata]|uniref:zinc metalloproteinase nas-4-like isoform X3 n=1 Tax=Orbicella faveolata TaxID=48498 RepID=UPI0009E3F83B|nr:zinc metalloproteinase nas-4-like isoform X3 [Orbicella faveolata]